MVEVDPLVLIAAGSAVVGIVTMIACTRPSKPLHPQDKKRRNVIASSHANHQASPTVVASEGPTDNSAPVKKGKKKVRSNKKKKNSRGADSPVPEGDDTQSEPEVEVKKTVVDSSTVDFDDDEDDLQYHPSLVSGISKPKKAKETPEQKAARIERQKIKELRRAAIEEKLAASQGASAGEDLSDSNSFNSQSPTQPQFDGWAVVEVKKPKKKEDEEVAATTVAPISAPLPQIPQGPQEPVIETVTVPMTVEARKIGLLIGPKGVTKIGIQVATGATIEMPKVDKESTATSAIINISGTADSVARAVHALNELCTKGYSTLLAGDDFQEGYVAIHPRFLADVIGKGGVIIRALQQHTGVKITTPATTSKSDGTPASKIKINLAGPREKVTEARNLIKEITKYYHTTVTHPGVVHTEMDIPAHYYNYIIGAKGSEIKHIQANFKVSVYIPNAESNNTNVLIVGEPANVVNAEKYVQKLIEKVNAIAEQKAAAEAVAEAYREANKAARAQAAAASGAVAATNGKTAAVNYSVGGGGKPSTAKVDKDDEPKEEWMKEFEPRSGGMDFSAMLPATAKLSAAPVVASTQESTAGNNLSEAAAAALPVSPVPVVAEKAAWGATATA